MKQIMDEGRGKNTNEIREQATNKMERFMKFLRFLLPLVVVMCGFTLSTKLHAEIRREAALHDRDFEIVHEYLNSKRTMDVQEKSCNLTISGDIRAEWRHQTEKESGIRVRGPRSVVFIDDLPVSRLDAGLEPVSRNEFDAVFNLYFDYVCDRAWGVVWLEFDNPAGIELPERSCEFDPQGCGGSGICDALCLQKAYMGYNVCCDGDVRFDIELGRRPFWTVFDSRIQFNSRFDGLLLKYSAGMECYGDFYVNFGGFLIDERVNDFGLIVETGFLNIMDMGLDFKYSFINWPKLGGGRNRCFVEDPRGFKFRNSQWTFAYHFNPELICNPATIYGAILWNHDARRRIETNDRKKGLGWYVGFYVGEIRQEGDWAFDMDYEVVQAQAINDCDVSGIGRGNVLDETFTANGRGNANYKGWRFEGDYALTDNLVLDAVVEFSRAEDKSIGATLVGDGQHSFSRFELEAIYAF